MGRLTKEEQKRRDELLARGLKVCCKCGRVLPVEQFFKDTTKKSGLKSKCKECETQYVQEHKEEKQQYHQQYYQENKKEILQYSKQYYQEHKEERQQYHKQRNEAIKNGTHTVIPRKIK